MATAAHGDRWPSQRGWRRARATGEGCRLNRLARYSRREAIPPVGERNLGFRLGHAGARFAKLRRRWSS